MNRSFNSIAIGLILIFIIQALSSVIKLSNITFIIDDKVLSNPPINITLYIIPTLFISYGILNAFLEKNKNN